MMTVLSLIYMSPNAQVSPNRQSRAIAPITQDLLGETNKKKKNGIGFSSTQKKACVYRQEDFAPGFSKKKIAYQNKSQGAFVFKLDAVCKSSSLRKYKEMEVLWA